MLNTKYIVITYETVLSVANPAASPITNMFKYAVICC